MDGEVSTTDQRLEHLRLTGQSHYKQWADYPDFVDPAAQYSGRASRYSLPEPLRRKYLLTVSVGYKLYTTGGRGKLLHTLDPYWIEQYKAQRELGTAIEDDPPRLTSSLPLCFANTQAYTAVNLRRALDGEAHQLALHERFDDKKHDTEMDTRRFKKVGRGGPAPVVGDVTSTKFSVWDQDVPGGRLSPDLLEGFNISSCIPDKTFTTNQDLNADASTDTESHVLNCLLMLHQTSMPQGLDEIEGDSGVMFNEDKGTIIHTFDARTPGNISYNTQYGRVHLSDIISFTDRAAISADLYHIFPTFYQSLLEIPVRVKPLPSLDELYALSYNDGMLIDLDNTPAWWQNVDREESFVILGQLVRGIKEIEEVYTRIEDTAAPIEGKRKRDSSSVLLAAAASAVIVQPNETLIQSRSRAEKALHCFMFLVNLACSLRNHHLLYVAPSDISLGEVARLYDPPISQPGFHYPPWEKILDPHSMTFVDDKGRKLTSHGTPGPVYEVLDSKSILVGRMAQGDARMANGPKRLITYQEVIKDLIYYMSEHVKAVALTGDSRLQSQIIILTACRGGMSDVADEETGYREETPSMTAENCSYSGIQLDQDVLRRNVLEAPAKDVILFDILMHGNRHKGMELGDRKLLQERAVDMGPAEMDGKMLAAHNPPGSASEAFTRRRINAASWHSVDDSQLSGNRKPGYQDEPSGNIQNAKKQRLTETERLLRTSGVDPLPTRDERALRAAEQAWLRDSKGYEGMGANNRTRSPRRNRQKSMKRSRRRKSKSRRRKSKTTSRRRKSKSRRRKSKATSRRRKSKSRRCKSKATSRRRKSKATSRRRKSKARS